MSQPLSTPFLFEQAMPINLFFRLIGSDVKMYTAQEVLLLVYFSAGVLISNISRIILKAGNSYNSHRLDIINVCYCEQFSPLSWGLLLKVICSQSSLYLCAFGKVIEDIKKTNNLHVHLAHLDCGKSLY